MVGSTHGELSSSPECMSRAHVPTSKQASSPTEPVTRTRRLSAAVELSLWLGLALGAALILLVVPRPNSWVLSAVFNASHAVVSLGIALVTLRLCGRLLETTRRWLHYLLAIGVVALLGGALETAQYVAPGEPALGDLVNDVLGGLSGLLIALGGEQRVGSRGWRGAARRWTPRLLGALVLGVLLWPVPRTLIWAAERARQFPTLANFEEPWESEFVRADAGASLAIEAPPPGFAGASGAGVGKVTFAHGEYPMLEVTELGTGWGAFDRLCFEVYSPQPAVVELGVSIYDREHVFHYTDRFNGSLTIPPGHTQVSIPMGHIRSGPKSRPLDLNRVAALVLFVKPRPSATVLYFDDFRLVSSTRAGLDAARRPAPVLPRAQAMVPRGGAW